MDLLNKHLESLIVQKALTLFFYNWNTYSEIVDEMKLEDSGFQHAWDKLVQSSKLEHEKNGGMWIIQYTDIFTLYALKLTYKSQALLIDKVLRFYGDEAREAIEFSIQMDAMATDRIKQLKKK